MVEITKAVRRIWVLTGAACFGTMVLQAGQPSVEARIAGLENNVEYMTLLVEDAELQIREDSVVRAVEGMRQRLRENPEDGRRFAEEILELENRIFEIRTAKGRLIDRINTIEQDWVLANLNGAAATPEPVVGAVPEVPDAEQTRNLVYNPCFRAGLPVADYAALLQAQRLETDAAECMKRYVANHTTLRQLAESYRAASTENDAIAIYDRYTMLEAENRALADSLSGLWNYIFDNKSYAYDYLLDKLGHEDLLAAQEDAVAEAARNMAELEGATAADEIVDYVLRKQVIVDYETAVAGALGLTRSGDSLRSVAVELCAVDYRLPRQTVEERSFLVFDSVAFSSVPKYTAKHPIPECRIHARGTIYRILLGTYRTQRPPTIFRGAFPLFYTVDDHGQWRYFAGGFATRQEAEDAQARLKKRGFVRPEIVVWNDGVYRNVSVDGEAAPGLFRVEIGTSDPLSEEVKAAIARTARDAGLSRAGQKFIVGMFDDRAAAERVESAIRQAAPDLEIKVAETTE